MFVFLAYKKTCTKLLVKQQAVFFQISAVPVSMVELSLGIEWFYRLFCFLGGLLAHSDYLPLYMSQAHSIVKK